MREKFYLVLITVVFSFIHPLFAQRYLFDQPRLVVGGDAAYFRISFDEFENVYKNKWGPSYGGFLGVNVYRSYYLVGKFGTFSQNGKQGVHEISGLNTADAKWDEKWYQVGVRLHPPLDSRWNSYYGFGFSFFKVNEVDQLSVLQTEKGTADHEWGSGFYLELGVEYFPLPYACLYGQFDLSSGGIRGNAGFEAMSVGGYRLAAGIAIYPF